MEERSVTSNRFLVIFITLIFLFGVYFSISSSFSAAGYRYTFDSYQYSYDKIEWMDITTEELKNNVFYTDKSLYIKASFEPRTYDEKNKVQSLVIETNDVGISVSCAGKLYFNELYKGSKHENEFIYGNNSQIHIVNIEDAKEMYDNGIVVELEPYDLNGGYININILSSFTNDMHIKILSRLAFSKVVVGVMLIALGSVFLLTLSSALRNENSLEYRYYLLGAISVTAGVFVLFLTNYYSTEQSNYYNFMIKGSYILNYTLTISYSVILYDVFVESNPDRRAYFKVVLAIGTIVTALLVLNIFTQTISNRTANYIFITTNFTFILISIFEFLYLNIKKIFRRQEINVADVILHSIQLFACFVLLIGINNAFQNKLSIVLNLTYFKIFVFVDICWLVLYTFEARKLTSVSKEIKEKAEKTGALTNMLLDMNKLLINLEKSNIQHALSDAVDILNMYLPELIFWEALILDLDKPKRFRLSKKDKMSLENALDYVLVCSESIINSEVVEVGSESKLIFVGASPRNKEIIGNSISNEFEEVYEKIVEKNYNDKDELIIKSKLPQFNDVFFYIQGLEKFKPDHRKQVTKNFHLVFETIENILLQNEMKRNQKQIIYDLTTISETKSKETYYHVTRVVNYTRVLAEGLGFSKEEVELVSIASAMHDIGKIATPYEILHKNGALTQDEFLEIKKHTVDGYEILKVNEGDLFHAAAIIARDHHEKYNGKGYRGIKGDDIHIYARIVSLADVFDALSSERAYKKPWPLDKVMNLIISESGEHFDPKVVDVFLNNFNEFLDIKRRYVD